MHRSKWFALTAASTLASLLAACSGSTVGSSTPIVAPMPTPGPPVGAYIKHVVIIVQENRSFENLFAGWPGASAPTFGINHKNEKVPLHSTTFEEEQDIGHLWSQAILEWNHGKMNQFDLNRFGTLGTGPLVGNWIFQYITHSEIAPYRALASQYVLADDFFPTEFGTSFTAHQDLIAGEAQIDSSHSLVDTPDNQPWGCDAPAGTTTSLVNLQRQVTPNGPFPCLTQYKTIADSLDAAHVSWRYYTENLTQFAGEVWNPFDAIKHVRYGPDWSRNIDFNTTNILTDPGKGQLQQVSWVIPDVEWSDHPAAPTDYGPSWVGDVINAIGKSKYWKDTAIVVVWDDWGGFYDNVPPQQLDYVGLAERTPMLVISPYARRGSVDHTQYEYGSLLKFIEQVFGAPSLHSTDDRATAPFDAFDFTQTPRAFTPIKTKYPPSFYINMVGPGSVPKPDGD